MKQESGYIRNKAGKWDVKEKHKTETFQILKRFITANNHELGNPFHLFTAKTRLDTFINFSLLYSCFYS